MIARVEVDGMPGWAERTFRGDEPVASGLLPGFAGTLAGLWAGMDEAE